MRITLSCCPLNRREFRIRADPLTTDCDLDHGATPVYTID
jgi:hypothetical protein